MICSTTSSGVILSQLGGARRYGRAEDAVWDGIRKIQCFARVGRTNALSGSVHTTHDDSVKISTVKLVLESCRPLTNDTGTAKILRCLVDTVIGRAGGEKMGNHVVITVQSISATLLRHNRNCGLFVVYSPLSVHPVPQDHSTSLPQTVSRLTSVSKVCIGSFVTNLTFSYLFPITA